MNITLGLNWPQNSCHLIGSDTEVRGAQRGYYGPNAEEVDRHRIMSDNLCFPPLQFHEHLREFNRVYRGLHTMISNQGTVLFYSSLKVELRSTLSLLRMNTLIVHRTKC